MFRSLTLATVTFLLCAGAQAQTSDLIFFTDDGAKFTLIIDGDVKNQTPATRVVATGIRNESPVVMMRFEDTSIPQLRKSGYFPLGMEYTVMVTTNKKGERVLRPTGEAPLGTTARTDADRPDPSGFREDPPAVLTTPASTTSTTTGTTGTVGTTTTVVVTEQVTDGPVGGENVNMTFGVNGLGVNMNVNVSGSGTGTTTTGSSTTTTTTTTTQTVISDPVAPPTTTAVTPKPEPDHYVMPGYSGRIGCPWPMNPSEFNDVKASIGKKTFEDTKMTMAKQIASDRCLTVDQVKGIAQLFSFEESKLDFAKFAYDRTYDVSNYFKVNDIFTFESSVDELTKFTKGR